MSVFHGDRTKSYAIKRPKSNIWPRTTAAFVVDAAYEDFPGRQSRSGEAFGQWGVLQGWHGCHTPPQSGGCGRTDWTNGKDGASFWSWLRRVAREHGTVWVFAWDLWPAWCLTDGVKEVSEGRLLLDVRSGSDSDKLPGGRPRKPSGLFIAENPPTIICLAVPGGGRIKMVDLANYGIQPEDYKVDGLPGKLAAAVQSVKDYRRLCDVYALGSLQTTAASQAWYCYRSSHMDHTVICHPIEKVLDLERAAYYGGRCEATRLGLFREKLYHLDVNSMYTYLGKLFSFPWRYVASWEPTGQGEEPPMREGIFIADVTVNISEPLVPAREQVKVDPLSAPTKRQGRERVIYPIGEFRTALCSPELGSLLLRGYRVSEWHRVQYYDHAPIMKNWCQFALSMRATLGAHGLSHLSGCCKKIINSLPGKWGQRRKDWVDFGGPYTPPHGEMSVDQWCQEWGRHPQSGAITTYRTIAGQTQYIDAEKLCGESCPSVAAYWTSYGRVYLMLLLTLADVKNVYYYDTDSLIVNQAGYDRMSEKGFLDPKSPGSLKLKESADEVEILGIRRYRFGPRWCVAGPFGGEIQGEPPPPQWTEHEGFGGQLWHGRVGDPVLVQRRARWRKDYHHGIVMDDGSIRPFQVGG